MARFGKITLIILAATFLYGFRCDDEETVGLAGLARLRAAAAKAHVRHDLALHRLKIYSPHHILLAPNPFALPEESNRSRFSLESPSLAPNDSEPLDHEREFTSNLSPSTLFKAQDSIQVEISLPTNKYEETKVKTIDRNDSTSNSRKGNPENTTGTKSKQVSVLKANSDKKTQVSSENEIVETASNHMTSGQNSATNQKTADVFGNFQHLQEPRGGDIASPSLRRGTNVGQIQNSTRQSDKNQSTDYQSAHIFNVHREDDHVSDKTVDGIAKENVGTKNFEISVRNETVVPTNYGDEDFLVRRRQFATRNKQDEELFLQYLNTIQSQNDAGVLRTSDDDDIENFNDRIYDDQIVRDCPRIVFYPIAWKTGGTSHPHSVGKYKLSAATYATSEENVEEPPTWKKFRALTQKMGDLRTRHRVYESDGARSASPDPHHVHSHSLQIHHTKYVRPSIFHHSRPSFVKHDQFSSSVNASGHSDLLPVKKVPGHTETWRPSDDNQLWEDSSATKHSNFQSPIQTSDRLFGHWDAGLPYVTVNNRNNFITGNLASGNHNVQIAQSSGGSISQVQSSRRGDQPFGLLTLASPYLFHFPRNGHRQIAKRSLPLIKLFADPNVQLDVAKTLENVGTAARDSLEDRRAPMYHMRNVMGSAKNTVFSTLKVFPQNAIIPSRYKIVDKNQQLLNPRTANFGGGDDDGALLKQTGGNFLEDEISGTFKKVGNVVRESVRSGQETLQHVGDVVHNAKKALASTRYSTPRLLLPYARTPVLNRDELDNRIVSITPRFADVTRKDQILGTTKTRDFLRLGEIMDAVGVSNPEKKDVGLSRFVLQSKKQSRLGREPIPNGNVKTNLQSKFGANQSGEKKSRDKSLFLSRRDPERNEIDDVSDIVLSIKKLIGTKTLRDFLTYAKQKFLFERLKEKELPNENVGRGLTLSGDLLKPFMGRPSRTELTDFFRKNGDGYEDYSNEITRTSVSAINPRIFNKYFDESLKINKKAKTQTDDAVSELATLEVTECGKKSVENAGGSSRSDETTIGMKIPKKLKKPFMGKEVNKSSRYL